MDIRDLQLTGKKALVRVDFNVPVNDKFEVTDQTRLIGAVPTLKYLLEQGAAVIIMSHFGRPEKDKNEDGSIKRVRYSLRHVVQPLSILLEQEVHFIDQTIGENVKQACAALNSGEVLILENTRFHSEEKKGDKHFAQQLAELGDVYINDAFGAAHRAHASTATVANYFPADSKSFGFLMQRELDNAKKLLDDPSRPFVAILGGAKVSDKIQLIKQMLGRVDHIIVGGGMAYTFFKAQGGSIGNSLVEEEQLELAKELLTKAEQMGVEIHLPVDSIVADAFSNDAKMQVESSMSISDGWMGLDIGPRALRKFSDVIHDASTIFWNGPMGVFEMENFSHGTMGVASAIAKATRNGAYSLVGGGDSVSAINQSGLGDSVSYISTGGGAMLTLLEGSPLPGVEAISGS